MKRMLLIIFVLFIVAQFITIKKVDVSVDKSLEIKADEEDRINLIFDNITINLSIEDAEILFQELSQILYGRVLKEEV